MGFFSAKKKEIEPKLIETPEQTSAKGLLSSYWQKYGQSYDPYSQTSPYQAYGGELSAKMPSLYGGIEPIISDYLAQPDNELLKLSKGEISKTLTGEYDPYTSEYYKSMKKGVLSDVSEAQQGLKQKAQQAGMYESLGRLMEEAGVEGEGQDRLNDILAELQWKERQNRLGVLPYAQQQGQYAEALPQRQLSTIASYAGLPGQWQQADLDRMYQEWLRQKEQQKYPMEVASNFLQGYQPTMYYPQYETTTKGWQKGLSFVNPIYHDIMTSQGANVPGMSMADTAKLAAVLASSLRYKKNIKLWGKHSICLNN